MDYPNPDTTSVYLPDSDILGDWLAGLPVGKYKSGVLYDAFCDVQNAAGEGRISHKRFVLRCMSRGLQRYKIGGVRYLVKREVKVFI